MDRLQIAVLISGNGETLQSIIDAQDKGHIDADICCVVSDNASAFGIQRAKNAGIATVVLNPKNAGSKALFEQQLIGYLEQKEVGLIVLAGFMRILSPRLVDHFSGKILNIHPSLLPKYPGLDTYQRAMAAGDTEHGTTVHFVDETVDGGAIILQARVPIFPEDSEDDVRLRVKEQEQKIYPLVIQWFATNRLYLRDSIAYLDHKPLESQGYAYDE